MPDNFKIVQDLSNGLRARLAHTTQEPVPQRWIDLIHYLNERERMAQAEMASKKRERPESQE